MQRWLDTLAVTLALSAILCLSAYGEQASETEMENVARNWVTEMTIKTSSWGGTTTPTLAGGHDILQDGVLLARYYDVSPRGYVVVPVLKEMTPVMFYSDESNLDESQEGGMLQLIKDMLVSRYEAYRQAYGDLDAVQPAVGEVLFARGQKAGWNRLAAATRDFRLDQSQAGLEEAGPLLTSSWHQRVPYNNACPMGDGGRCAVGCAATSFSQILDYWEWPLNGGGSHYYLWGGDFCNGGNVPAQFLLADFSDPYDWANIPDSCDGAEGCTAEQEAAVAELCYEVGVSLDMNYSACGSGTYMIMNPFVNYFKYSGAISREYRLHHTQQGWFDLIRSEIDSGRVMWYAIHSHAIVCDGYRDNAGQLEYHMNYGWGQQNNAWYVLDNLACSWVPGGICPYEGENLVINIKPQYTPILSLKGATTDDSPGDGDGLAEAGETIRVTPIIVNGGNDASGTAGVLTTSDPYITISGASTTFDPLIGLSDTSTALTPVEISIASGCPNPYVATCSLSVTCDGGYQNTSPLQLFVGNVPGFEDDMESGPGAWTSRAVSVMKSNEWHLETYRSYSGAASWKAGGVGSEPYSVRNDGVLVTPPFLLPAGAWMTFWHWIDANIYSGTLAWDGGVVLIRESGGAWTQIGPIDNYPYSILRGDGPFLPGTPCYSGTYDWTEEVFDLSAYSGVVEIMFRFGTDEYGQGEGWYIDDIWIGNTFTGTNVSLSPVAGVTVTFEEVSSPGTTSVAVSPSGPEPPFGYAAIPSSPREYYSLTTDAVYSGDAEVCLTYSDGDGFGDETSLRVLSFNGDVWSDVTGSLDTDSNEICCNIQLPTVLLVVEKIGCCVGRVGDANSSGEDEPTIADVSTMIDAKFLSGTCDGILLCLPEADINRSGGTAPACEDITIGDITLLIDYLFITGRDLGLADCL